MPKYLYDAALKEDPDFKSLYARYVSKYDTKYREGFDTFMEFYEWSMENGYVPGAKFMRRDEDKPHNPDNCYWKPPEEKKHKYTSNEQKEMIEKWNKVVNRIRVHYGLEPFEQKEIADDETIL